MIAYLNGRLHLKEPGHAIIDVNGVGYQVNLSENAYNNLPEIGAQVSIDIFTNVREDDISLYGFYNDLEKNCFKMLLSVSGIGPKTGMAIISKIEAPRLSKFIESADVDAISKVPGIGKKTAQRIIVELKGKMTNIFSGINFEGKPRTKCGQLVDDVSSALMNLGYPKTRVDEALSLIDLDDTWSVPRLIKETLKRIKR